ncbi:MAG: hypothetical protein JSV18_02925 [Candidatus Bathyarchaeota archaeon]|nr:MAG: hypothetical protein JSV18_02925 [Candidatus Bathyarchaeota archaeon]
MAEAVSKVEIMGVEISVFSHATEDEAKVERAVKKLIPKDASGIRLDRRLLSGHHNDPITLITTTIRKKKDVAHMLHQTIKRLPTVEQMRLLDELENRTDKAGNMYIRLDKQKALKGQRALMEIDPIRLKFRFRIPHKASPLEYIRTTLTRIMEEKTCSNENRSQKQ